MSTNPHHGYLTKITDAELVTILVHEQGCVNFVGQGDVLCGLTEMEPVSQSCECLRIVRALREAIETPASPDVLTALTKLSNEVLGTLPLIEPLARRELGNTNYNILIQRAVEARALITKVQGKSS